MPSAGFRTGSDLTGFPASQRILCSHQIPACPESRYDLRLPDFLSNFPALLLPSRIEILLKKLWSGDSNALEVELVHEGNYYKNRRRTA
jgi:hypothetical protein